MTCNLFHNTKIYSLENDRQYNWLLSCHGRIIALGTGRNFPSLPGVVVQKIDLDGGTVIPAFTDSHAHLLYAAQLSSQAGLEHCNSLNEALLELSKYQKSLKKGQWLQGGGYNKNKWKDASPHRKHLDQLFPDNPVALYSKDMHSFWVNTAALRVAGIDERSASPPNGRIEKDSNGLTGLLYEGACHFIREQIPELSFEQQEKALQAFYPELYAKGITSVHTMETLNTFSAYQYMHKSGKRELRMNVYIFQEEMDALISAGMRSNLGDEWLKFAGVKFFVDGSLGSQTAEMLEPYENNHGYFGVEVMGREELAKKVVRSAENGLAAAVHAIGDRAVEKTIEAFELAASHQKKYNLIQRIEHAQLVPPYLMKRITRLGLVASVQPVHIADDVVIADKYWGRRCQYAYPLNEFIKSNVPIAFGSDMPVADPDPLKGIYAAVNRRYQNNPEMAKWHPEQSISKKEAIVAYTKGAAFASGEMNIKGTLSPGKVADFIQLNHDPFTTDNERLSDINVIKTILNGEIVYKY